MKVATVVGARPQFVKAAPLSLALRDASVCEVLIHTGQHYDANMSDIFFDELGIRRPDVNLGIGSGGHGTQTGEMLIRLESVLIDQRPDAVIVFGDTNSTLAAALVSVKLHIPVVHIEAGLRSFNRQMPEEINRILTDHIANLLLCPSQIAVKHLAEEGIQKGVHIVGDIMFDAVKEFVGLAETQSKILAKLGLEGSKYILATIHRAESADDPQKLLSIFTALCKASLPVVFPIHPRTKNRLSQLNFKEASDLLLSPAGKNILMIDPVGYLDMLRLESNARVIVTDSGGIQKEAYWLSIPCVTVRTETEWTETLESGCNVLVGTQTEKITSAISHYLSAISTGFGKAIYGDGKAAKRCVQLIQTLR